MSATKTETNPYGFRAPFPLMKERVEPRLAEAAVSLSLVVHTIFVEYLNQPPLGVNLGKTELGDTLPLPKQAAKTLVKMHDSMFDVERGNDRFNAYLSALNEAGWSMQAVGEVLGMTRQAVSLRVKKAADLSFDDLPPVPERSPLVRAKTNLDSGAVHKFSVRLDTSLHAAVRDRAKREGAGITAILVDGLERFANGDLPIPDKPDAV